MFTFRYIGHFDLDNPIVKVSDSAPAVPKVLRPIPRAVFDDLLDRYPVDRSALKWYYGSIMSFLSRPGEFHPFERALIEEANCSALNMRLEVICRPGVGTAPLVDEVWAEEDYLAGPRGSEQHWCEVFYQRLVSPEKPDEKPVPTLQGQLLRAATLLEYEMASGGQCWDDAVDVFLAYEEFILARLCDGTFDAQACAISRRAMAGLNQWMNREECDSSQVMDDLGKMLMLTYHWCRLHPEVLPPAAVMWDNPS